MTKKMGRPKKASSDEKIAIVDQYYISQSNEDASAIGQHGVYRRLSDFAKAKGNNLEPHDFSRDKAVTAHIITLTSTVSECTSSLSAIPAYEPLDITVLMAGSKNAISETLRSREQYFESLHKKAARAIESSMRLSKKTIILKENFSRSGISSQLQSKIMQT